MSRGENGEGGETVNMGLKRAGFSFRLFYFILTLVMGVDWV